MADKKLDLTRRKALLSMGTIGVAGATGAGAWARFTDKERKIFEAEAGHLDLKFKTKRRFKKDDGSWGYKWIKHNGPIELTWTNVKNRDVLVDCEWLINKGSVPGNELCAKLKKIEDEENDLLNKGYDYGPHGDDPGDNLEKSKKRGGGYKLDETPNRGELSKFLFVIGFLWCPKGDKYHCRMVNFADGTVEDTGITAEDPTSYDMNYRNFRAFAGRLRDLEGKQVCVQDKIKPNEKCLFCVVAFVGEKGTKYKDMNIAMTDETEATVDFKLKQTKGDVKKPDEIEIGEDD